MIRTTENNITEAKLKVTELAYKINSIIEEFIRSNARISLVAIAREIPKDLRDIIFGDTKKDNCFFQLLGVYPNF